MGLTYAALFPMIKERHPDIFVFVESNVNWMVSNEISKMEHSESKILSQAYIIHVTSKMTV